jgi:hypothetical protein
MARGDLNRPHCSSLFPARTPGQSRGSAGLFGWARTVLAGWRSRRTLLLALAGLALGLVGSAARAQAPSPNQPLAIDGLPPPPCPLLVPATQSALQPLRIQPSQVAGKNAMGCLSPADAAVYGPDGCPVKLCHPPQGTVPLPQL